MKPVVFVDLDSTISNSSQRAWFINDAVERGEQVDWERYAMLAADDTPFEGVVHLLRMLWPIYGLVIVSGRTERAYDLTRRWLYSHQVPFNHLILRPANDARPNEDYKVARMREFLMTYRLSAPALVIDDWPPVRDRLESEGWPVLLVNPAYGWTPPAWA